MTSPSRPTPSADDADSLRAAMDRIRGTKALQRSGEASEPVAEPRASASDGPSRQFWDVRGRVADDLARVPLPQAATWPRPLAGLVAGLWSALMSWLVFAGVELTAWIFAPLGSGSFSDVMRGSGGTWIIANGGALRWQGAVLSLPPLLATLVVLLFQRRAGSWLISAVDVTAPRAAAIPLGFAVIAAASTQALAAALVMNATLVVPLWRSMLGAVLVAVIGFGWGISRTILITVPDAVRPAVLAVQRFFLGLSTAAVVAVLASAVVHWRSFVDVLRAVAGDSTSALEVLLLCALFVPSLIGWAAAFLLGPGFSLGQGTAVAMSGVHLGALPPIPLLALVPSSARGLSWLLLGVPCLLAIWATRGVAHGTSWRVVVVTLAGAAVTGAVLAAAVTGGIGPGRLGLVGTGWWQVGVACAGWLAFGLATHAGWARLRRMLDARTHGPNDAGKLPS